MPALSGREFLSIVLELVCGVSIGSILATILKNAIDPIIVFIIIIATIIAILDFADYLPAFSVAYFAGYIGEFLYPLSAVFGDLKIPVLVVALIGMGVVVVLKASKSRDRHTL
jgi:hypothetical protein